MATLPPAEPTRDFSPDVDARLDGDERARAARQAFAALSQKDQDVVTLCVIEELSIAQASAALGIPSGTVKSRLFRAKQKLASVVTELSDSTIAPGGAR
jgi:RNA polymerase sigma-70 factor (ECF subfamily)